MERERKPSPTGALHLNVLVYPEESSSHRQHMTLKPGEDWKVCKSVQWDGSREHRSHDPGKRAGVNRVEHMAVTQR